MIRIAVPDLVSNSYFPAIAAVELGFFKSEGLDASIDLLFPVPKTFAALRDGQLDLSSARRMPRYWLFQIGTARNYWPRSPSIPTGFW